MRQFPRDKAYDVCARVAPTLSGQHARSLPQACAQLRFCGFEKGPDTEPLPWAETCVVFYADFYVLMVVYCKEMGAVATHEQCHCCALVWELSHLCAHK